MGLSGVLGVHNGVTNSNYQLVSLLWWAGLRNVFLVFSKKEQVDVFKVGEVNQYRVNQKHKKEQVDVFWARAVHEQS